MTGLGDQATVLFEAVTVLDGAGKGVSNHEVDLFVRSGNVVTEVTYWNLPTTVELPAAIAISRDVLAALPRA